MRRERKHWTVRAMCVLIVLTTLSCCKESQSLRALEADPMLAELLVIQHADPVQACRAAMARKDFRFLGILGFSLYFPGIDEFGVQIENKHDYHVIQGTGDAGEPTVTRTNKAYEYASVYNQMLMRVKRDTYRKTDIEEGLIEPPKD